MPEENTNQNGNQNGGESGERPIRMNDLIERPVMEDREYTTPGEKVFMKVAPFFDLPVTWIRENIVERFRGPKYYYYHQRFKRVPTIDQCYTDDYACMHEANLQFKRDKKVDGEIVNILRNRFFRCIYYERNVNEYNRNMDLCLKEKKDFKDAELNYFIKYGDLGIWYSVIDVYMKQKHRLIWERRQREKELVEEEQLNRL